MSERARAVSTARPSSRHLQGRRDAAESVSSVTTPARGDKSGREGGREAENRRDGGRENTHHP